MIRISDRSKGLGIVFSFAYLSLFSVVRIYAVVSQSVDHEDVVNVGKLGTLPRYMCDFGV